MEENTAGRPADVMLNFYNSICRVRVKPYEKNLRLIEKCLELNGQNEEELQEYMKWYCLYKNDQDLKPNFEECMREYGDYCHLSVGHKEVLETQVIPDKETTEEKKPTNEIVTEEPAVGEVEVLVNDSDSEKEEKKSTKRKKSDKEKTVKEAVQKGRKKRTASGKEGSPAVTINTALDDVNGEGDMPNTAKEANEITQINSEDPFGMLGASMAGLFQNIVSEALSSKYENMLEETKKEIMSFVEERYGERVQTIKLEFDDERLHPLEDEVVHEKMQEVLNFVAANEPVYLVGPTGCGKNHICKQVAKILGLPFYFSNAVTQEFKLVGFTDANGVYQETQFYKAFKDGGIFMLDEMDASLPDALIILNAAISNGYFDFPAPVGFVEVHPDFRIIAAGNTWGCGADIQYVGRNQLDMASLDRFAVVNMDYSYSVEAALCPDAELQKFLRDYRNAVYRNGLMTTVSYRVFRRMYLLEDRFENLYECLDACLCKGLCRDDLLMIHKHIKSDSKYKKALKELAESRR